MVMVDVEDEVEDLTVDVIKMEGEIRIRQWPI
jgi:hypothetical protein